MYRFDLVQKTIDVINSSMTYEQMCAASKYIDLAMQHFRLTVNVEYANQVGEFLYQEFDKRISEIVA